MFKNKSVATVGIIGLGRFGMPLAKRLCELGKEVLVADEDEAKIKEIRNDTEYAFVTSDLKKETLEDLGFHNCEVVVVCIGEKMDVSILATLNVLSLGVPKVISKAVSYEQGYVLEKLGAEVVYPEHDMALRLAKRIVACNVLDYISLNSEIEITEIRIPRAFVGLTVKNSDIRRKYGLNIIAIEHEGGISTDVDPEYCLIEGDIVVVIGKRDNIHKFEAV